VITSIGAGVVILILTPVLKKLTGDRDGGPREFATRTGTAEEGRVGEPRGPFSWPGHVEHDADGASSAAARIGAAARIAKRFPLTAGVAAFRRNPRSRDPSNHDPEGVARGNGHDDRRCDDVARRTTSGPSRGNAFGVRCALVVSSGGVGETPTPPAFDEHAFSVAHAATDGRAPIAKRFTLTAGPRRFAATPGHATQTTTTPKGSPWERHDVRCRDDVACREHVGPDPTETPSAFGRVVRFVRGCRRDADTPGFQRTRLRRGARVDLLPRPNREAIPVDSRGSRRFAAPRSCDQRTTTPKGSPWEQARRSIVAMTLHAATSGRSHGNAFGVRSRWSFHPGCRRDADTPGFQRTRLRRGASSTSPRPNREAIPVDSRGRGVSPRPLGHATKRPRPRRGRRGNGHDV
jgi:hypothetical protein